MSEQSGILLTFGSPKFGLNLYKKNFYSSGKSEHIMSDNNNTVTNDNTEKIPGIETPEDLNENLAANIKNTHKKNIITSPQKRL